MNPPQVGASYIEVLEILLFYMHCICNLNRVRDGWMLNYNSSSRGTLRAPPLLVVLMMLRSRSPEYNNASILRI